MKISEGWLKEHLETSLSFEHLGEVLTDIGLEVESFEPPRHDLSFFKSAYIVSVSPHPHAQKLQICQVRTGQGQDLTIVCGAPNARADLHVVLAPIGSIIPTSGLCIQATEIRGIASEGMLCSAQELGIGSDSDGIIELAPDVALGTPYATLCGWDEGVWDINITPNRGDCLSVRGIARDLVAKGVGQWRAPRIATADDPVVDPLTLDNSSWPDACSVFRGRWIRGLRHEPSPVWLKRRLQRVGLKPISAVVDILQWVMWDQGHPMHAYDAKTLVGDVQIRRAHEGEVFEGLNGKTYTLNAQNLVVADAEKPIALAGILGSLNTACSEATTDIFLEAAVFSQETIACTGQRLTLTTDARARFERGVDAQNVVCALDLATKLILDICGGEVSGDVSWAHPQAGHSHPSPILLSQERFRSLTGIHEGDIEAYAALLERLGCDVRRIDTSTLEATPPSWRHDLKLDVDLMEEILRLIGYDQIPERAPVPPVNLPMSDARDDAHHRMRQTLVMQGYTETVQWSFVHDHQVEALGLKACVSLENPISQELNVLRPSLLPQLLDQMKRHQDEGVKNVALFEIGPVFRGMRPEDQGMCVAGVRTSSARDPHWHRTQPAYDVFDLKADVWRLVEAWGFHPERLQMSTVDLPLYYHPGRASTLRQGPRQVLGTWGALHPAQQALWGLDAPIMIFEMWIDRWSVKPHVSCRTPWHFSPYPAVWRDFSFVVDASVHADLLIKGMGGVDPEHVRSVHLFDVYDDPAWQGQRRSYTFRVWMRSDTQTLADAQIQDISAKIIQKVTQTWSGTLRNG